MTKINVLDEEFIINSENDLVLLLISINKIGGKDTQMLIWNVLTELNFELENFIETNQGLNKILKNIDQKRAILVLNNLSDKLPYIIENSENLAELLASFSSGKGFKTQIIRNLRPKGLKYLIKTGRDFKNVVEWLYGSAENELFKLLERDFLISLFSNSKEIGEVYYYLNNSNKAYFTYILGIENLALKIFTYKDLLNLKGMLIKDFELLLKHLGKEKVLSLFSFEEDFYEFLLALSQTKEKSFIKFLKNNK